VIDDVGMALGLPREAMFTFMRVAASFQRVYSLHRLSYCVC